MRGSPNHFTLVDFMPQISRVREHGSIDKLIDMIPGVKDTGVPSEAMENQLRRMEAIYSSMKLARAESSKSPGRKSTSSYRSSRRR